MTPAITGPRMFDAFCAPPSSAFASCRRSDEIVSGSSPFIAGFVGGASLRVVFFVDLALMAVLALFVHNAMVD